MYRAIAFAAAGLLSAAWALGAPDTGAPPADQAALERSFDAAIKPDELRDWMKLMAAEPNHVGSPHDKANAEWELARFKEWGWDAR